MNKSACSRILTAILLYGLGLAPARAAIVGIVPGSATATFTFLVGGVPMSSTGVTPLAAYPGFSMHGDSHPTAGFAGMDLCYAFTPTAATVFIPDIGPVAIASQAGPAPGDGAVTVMASFSVSFFLDAGGTPVTTIPIAYPVAYGGTALGTLDTFDVSVAYSSAALGPLGVSGFSAPFYGPAGSPYEIVTGPDLTLPALPGLDTLTLSGTFKLTADGYPGASTEIEVFGIPEPSATSLFVLAGLAMCGWRPRRAS